MLYLTHTADLSKKRIEIFDGEEHLVIPVIAAVQGVLNGQFLPITSLEASLPAWEGAAITMSHPKKHGEDVSANSQFAVENFVVGRFFNAVIEGNKFKGEFWINLEKLSEHADGEDFLALVEEGAIVEVSTAYWCQTDSRGGIYEGKQYSGVQTHIVPNHIAILLHQEGACSVADGCGTRTNKEKKEMAKKKKKLADLADVKLVENCDTERQESVMNKLRQKFGDAVIDVFTMRGGDGLELNRISHDTIRRNLRELLAQEERSDSFVFIVDVFDDEVVYARELPGGETDLFSRNYTLGSSPGYVITLEEPVEVEQVVTYEPVSNTQEEENDMDRDALIERLATNDGTPFTREQLTDMNDDQLAHLSTNLEAETVIDPVKDPVKEPVTDPVTDPVKEPIESDVQNALTPEVAEALNKLGADGITQITNAADALATERKTQKDGLVSKLVANQAVTMDEATLRRMDLEALEGVARMVGVSTSYAGVGGPVMNKAKSNGPPPSPRIVLAPLDED